MLVRWQKGAWLRPHIAAKRQPIAEARCATDAAWNVDLEALALTSALNTQWTIAFMRRKSASRCYHLWSIQQSFLWPQLCVPLSLSKGVMTHSQLECRLCWHPATQMLCWTLPIPPLCKTVLGRSGADFSLDFWHSFFQPWTATPREMPLFYVLALPVLAGGKREENKPETPRNSINKQSFLFNVVLKRARDLGSRRRREDYSLSIGECFSQTQNKNELAPLPHITASWHPAWMARCSNCEGEIPFKVH